MFKKYAGKIGCLLGCLLFLIFVVNSLWIVLYFEDRKENMPSKDSTSLGFFLPDQATNISYYRNFGYTYYECEISEKDALEFTSKEGWTMQPIGEEPIRMWCSFFSTTNGPQRTAAMEYFEKYGEGNYPYYISEGYYFDDMTNRGGNTIVYDTSLGKLFFQMSRR